MVGGFGKEILNGVWAAVTLEHDTSPRTCVGYWVNPLIPYWSFPSRIWVCNFSVESMLPMCRVVCSRKVQPNVTVITSVIYRSSSMSLVP